MLSLVWQSRNGIKGALVRSLKILNLAHDQQRMTFKLLAFMQRMKEQSPAESTSWVQVRLRAEVEDGLEVGVTNR